MLVVYTTSMPRLTGEELSELYPKAKSFDQLRAESAQLQELRRPRLVALRIALCTTVCAVALLIAYRLIIHTIPTSQNNDPQVALVGVGMIGLILAATLAVLWYLRSLIENVVSKTIAAPALLYTSLIAALLLAGAGFSVLHFFLHDEVLEIALLLGTTFILSLLAVMSILRNQ